MRVREVRGSATKLKQSLSVQAGMFDGPSGLFEFNCFTICIHSVSVMGLNLKLGLCLIAPSISSSLNVLILFHLYSHPIWKIYRLEDLLFSFDLLQFRQNISQRETYCFGF